MPHQYAIVYTHDFGIDVLPFESEASVDEINIALQNSDEAFAELLGLGNYEPWKDERLELTVLDDVQTIDRDAILNLTENDSDDGDPEQRF